MNYLFGILPITLRIILCKDISTEHKLSRINVIFFRLSTVMFSSNFCHAIRNFLVLNIL